MDLENRHIVVTGGASGIGRAMVERFRARGGLPAQHGRTHPDVQEIAQLRE